MTGLTVCVPTRGRPDNWSAFDAAAHSTATLDDTAWVAVINDDDDAMDEYALRHEDGTERNGFLPVVAVNMVAALNLAVTAETELDEHGQPYEGQPFAVGFCGDDHRMRTTGWDAMILEQLRSMGTGIVYGNDLIMGAGLATQVFMTADIVRALGYMAPPALHHLFVDNVWMDWGRGAGCLQYLGDVQIEHMHPLAGKAEQDVGYDRANATWHHDQDAYERYKATRLADDVAKIKALL